MTSPLGTNGNEAMSPMEFMARIRSAAQSNDLAGAMRIADQARNTHPSDASLADALGTLALKLGDAEKAVAQFGAACTLAPQTLDYALNRSIALQRLERHADAIALLEKHETVGRSVARYGSIRALSHRALGQPAEAAHWYDAALSLEPGHALSLHGRARVAIERGEEDAVARFDAALAVNQGEADLWLGKAQALDVAGDGAGALAIAEQLSTQAPGFIAAHSFLAGLRLAAGESDFAAPFRNAGLKAPQDPNIAATHAETLAGLDFAAEAADVAADARARFPNEPHFTLLEAVHSGSAGDLTRAEAVFAQLPSGTPRRAVHEARHRIRTGEFDRADGLLEEALADEPWDITAWSLRGIVWRLLDGETAKANAAWLHEQDGLIQFRPLVARSDLLDDATEHLRVLHAGSAMPLGQSLRGGTQTRGVLFHRTEAILSELHDAIVATLEEYRADLPKMDKTHPMLRLRDEPWRLAGSWSVRLTGGGDHHTAHIHPQGMISSALYLVVPDASSQQVGGKDRQGWLEIGRPKSDLGLNLEPLASIQPKPGHLALFPSTAYHGTTPFASGKTAASERMTVAFDVVS
ncbi:putative 2OG-Fe(II) oxygenase [Erythrobacter sp. Alg231-14]|uniref:putative 2OG-Fe(II) oxygenase n=1 Tax=Erythrobacter sp. Alg231-14 TaxID=1922225 RepID=UPI000D54C9EC